MWELVSQLRKLFESTQMTTEEVAQAIAKDYGGPVHGAEIRKAMNAKDSLTRKETSILLLAHQYLTKVQEDRNKEIERALRRAEKALKGVRTA